MSILTPAAPPARAYLGKGLAFPLAIGANGRLARTSGEAKVEQSIALILSTAKGERVMRPSHGCAIHDMVFAPNDPSNVVRITEAVRQALADQEPRIVVLDVTAEQDVSHPSLVVIRVDYRVHANNTIANLVYPFFIREGQ
jgi:phage baseplate assembly protein W